MGNLCRSPTQGSGLPVAKKRKAQKNNDRLNGLLRDFWRRANLEGDDSQDRLSLLREFSEVRLLTLRLKVRRKERRHFERRVARDFSGLEKGDWFPCFVCWRPATVRHHIVQLQFGGDNRPSNVAKLCKPCHSEVHPWLRAQTNGLPNVLGTLSKESRQG